MHLLPTIVAETHLDLINGLNRLSGISHDAVDAVTMWQAEVIIGPPNYPDRTPDYKVYYRLCPRNEIGARWRSLRYYREGLSPFPKTFRPFRALRVIPKP